MGSSTLANWIKKNMDMDAKNPNRGKDGTTKPGASNQEIQKLRQEIARMKDFMSAPDLHLKARYSKHD